MPLFQVCTLCSGSKGNAIYVNTCGVQMLFDCGMSLKALQTALVGVGTSLAEITAVMITHEHIDHVRGLKMLLKKYPTLPVHIPALCAQRYCETNQMDEIPQSFVLHPPTQTLRFGGEVTVSSFLSSHDSCMCVGYRIDTPTHSLGIATDTGVVTDQARAALLGTEYAILEANHDENMLMMGPYPYSLKRRIRSTQGHLSNDDCGALAVELLHNGTKKILLAHLSENNNMPQLAVETVRSCVRMAGMDDCAIVGAAKPKEVFRFVCDGQ